MKLSAAISLGLTAMVMAYPPAPFHRIHGQVRDERGNPLPTGGAVIILSNILGNELVRTPIDANVGTGINYSLPVPMDSGIEEHSTDVNALRPMFPFTIRVVIGSMNYVPIEMVRTAWAITDPADQTRLDLTLGVDSDGDGLPDAWETDLLNADPSGGLATINNVTPGGDLDGDGISNYDEYIAGTYALESSDGLRLEIDRLVGGRAHMRFLAITGRTYQVKSINLKGESVVIPFSIETDGSSPGLSFLATEVREISIQVEVGSEPKKFFVLNVE